MEGYSCGQLNDSTIIKAYPHGEDEDHGDNYFDRVKFTAFDDPHKVANVKTAIRIAESPFNVEYDACDKRVENEPIQFIIDKFHAFLKCRVRSERLGVDDGIPDDLIILKQII